MMEIVIKIPEDVYTRLFDKGIQDNEIATDDICEMAKALRLGTPLDSIIADIEATRDKDKLCEYPYNRCIDILTRAD